MFNIGDRVAIVRTEISGGPMLRLVAFAEVFNALEPIRADGGNVIEVVYDDGTHVIVWTYLPLVSHWGDGNLVAVPSDK